MVFRRKVHCRKRICHLQTLPSAWNYSPSPPPLYTNKERRGRRRNAQTYKAIACLVLCRPTTWAFFALCIDWLFAGLAEAQLSKALAGVIWGVRQVGAWPAGACWALARWVGAAWTNSRARTGFWEHCRWFAKPNGSLVMHGVTRNNTICRPNQPHT